MTTTPHTTDAEDREDRIVRYLDGLNTAHPLYADIHQVLAENKAHRAAVVFTVEVPAQGVGTLTFTDPDHANAIAEQYRTWGYAGVTVTTRRDGSVLHVSTTGPGTPTRRTAAGTPA